MTKSTNRSVQYFAGICASFAFTLTGATLSWSSPVIPKFKSGEANIQLTDGQISWIVSLAPLGALPGCYIGQVLSERLGRRRTVLCAALPGIAGAAMILFTKIAEVMYVARLLLGISNGITAVICKVRQDALRQRGGLPLYSEQRRPDITAVVTMVYLTEIADKEIRGALGMLVQVMINLGALAMYGIGPFVSYNAVNSLLTTIPILNLLICLWIPESPYFHLKNGRFAAAKKEYMVIKSSKDAKAAEEELRIIRAHVRESMENKSTMKELFFKHKYRRAVYIIIGTSAWW